MSTVAQTFVCFVCLLSTRKVAYSLDCDFNESFAPKTGKELTWLCKGFVGIQRFYTVIFGLTCVRCALVCIFVMEMVVFGQSKLSSADTVELRSVVPILQFVGLYKLFYILLMLLCLHFLVLQSLLSRTGVFSLAIQYCQVELQGLQSSLSEVLITGLHRVFAISFRPVVVYKYNYMHLHMHSKVFMHLTLH